MSQYKWTAPWRPFLILGAILGSVWYFYPKNTNTPTPNTPVITTKPIQETPKKSVEQPPVTGKTTITNGSKSGDQEKSGNNPTTNVGRKNNTPVVSKPVITSTNNNTVPTKPTVTSSKTKVESTSPVKVTKKPVQKKLIETQVTPKSSSPKIKPVTQNPTKEKPKKQDKKKDEKKGRENVELDNY